MPTPPRESIGGKLLPDQELSFKNMNSLYSIVDELEQFNGSKEFSEMSEEDQQDYETELRELNIVYEKVLNRVNEY